MIRPSIGDVFEFAYPFVRETVSLMDEEGGMDVPSWRPGIRLVPRYDDQEAQADAMGHQILTVIGLYRPGPFPERVFYTRQWRDPDGKVFGKTKLRISALNAFSYLRNGYRHQFTISEQKEPANA